MNNSYNKQTKQYEQIETKYHSETVTFLSIALILIFDKCNFLCSIKKIKHLKNWAV